VNFLIEQASSFAADIDGLIIIIAVLAGFWFFVAEFVLFYFIFKYSRKNQAQSEYITGEEPELVKWVHWPHIAVLVCDIVIIFFAVKVWYNVKQDFPQPDETIRVVGYQWSWKFVHPGADKQLGTEDDIEMIDELHLKVNTTYHFKLESEDVMHSFSIPVFRLKQDAVPGRVITGWFKPIKTGQYDIQCAEMCGIGHGIMGSQLYVESEEDHNKWIQSVNGQGETLSQVQ
jgi:cytochrome c oxidase subunit II